MVYLLVLDLLSGVYMSIGCKKSKQNGPANVGIILLCLGVPTPETGSGAATKMDRHSCLGHRLLLPCRCYFEFVAAKQI
jgi:hypothetical protein